MVTASGADRSRMTSISPASSAASTSRPTSSSIIGARLATMRALKALLTSLRSRR